MRPSSSTALLAVLACVAAAVLGACGGSGRPPSAASDGIGTAGPREEDYRQAARLRGQALAAMDAADWSRAISALEQLEELLPANVLAPLDLAVCHRQLGNEAEALAAARRARALAPSNPRLLYALASIHHDGGDREAWEAVLGDYARAHPYDPRPHYLRTRWLELEGEPAAAHEAAAQAVRREPENLVLLVARLVTAGGAGLLDETGDALDAVEDRLGGFEGPLAQLAADLRRALDDGRSDDDAASSLPPLTQVMRNVLRPEGLYRQHLIPLVGSGSAGNGFFVQLDFDPPLPKSIQGGQDIEITFTDRTAATHVDSGELLAGGTSAGEAILGALRLDTGDSRDAVLATTAAGAFRLEWNDGRWRSEREERDGPGSNARVWSRLDIDQDGVADRLTESDGRLTLDASTADGKLLVADLAAPLVGVYPVDVDHDGDLDLVTERRCRHAIPSQPG